MPRWPSSAIIETKSGQPSEARGGAGVSARRSIGRGTAAIVVEDAGRRARPDAGQQVEDAEAGDAVARILGEAQQRQHVLDVRRIEELQPAVLHERNVAPRELDLERTRVTATSGTAPPAA